MCRRDSVCVCVCVCVGGKVGRLMKKQTWVMWCVYMLVNMYMWQSQVEIEHYSVAYFVRIAVFKAL